MGRAFQGFLMAEVFSPAGPVNGVDSTLSRYTMGIVMLKNDFILVILDRYKI
jgi:hypothetical protein